MVVGLHGRVGVMMCCGKAEKKQIQEVKEVRLLLMAATMRLPTLFILCFQGMSCVNYLKLFIIHRCARPQDLKKLLIILSFCFKKE